MILTVTSLKGGVGKTTICGLLALYLAHCRRTDVILIDLDPQMGSTALFLPQKGTSPTAYDLLEPGSSLDLAPSLFRDALQRSPFAEHVFILPGDPRLSLLAPNTPSLNTLGRVLLGADLPVQTMLVIDTGTMRVLVETGITAADTVLIPVMLSQQTIKPTANTLSIVQRSGVPLLGLMPVEAGEARWERELLEGWQKTVTTRYESLHLVDPERPLLEPLPFSRHLARAQWAASPFPERFYSIFQSLEQRLMNVRLDATSDEAA